IQELRGTGGAKRVGKVVAIITLSVAVLAAPWYVTNRVAFLDKARTSVAAGPLEGDPELWTADSNLYYLGLMVNRYAAAPARALLLLAAGTALVQLARRGPSALRPWPASRAGSLVASWL